MPTVQLCNDVARTQWHQTHRASLSNEALGARGRFKAMDICCICCRLRDGFIKSQQHLIILGSDLTVEEFAHLRMPKTTWQPLIYTSPTTGSHGAAAATAAAAAATAVTAAAAIVAAAAAPTVVSRSMSSPLPLPLPESTALHADTAASVVPAAFRPAAFRCWPVHC